VSLVGGLYRRFRHLIHEFAKFGVVGGIGFLVTEGVFNLMISEHQATFTANAVATLVAAAVTFVGNRHWTFRHRERTGMGREAIVFFSLNGIGVLIQQACLELAKHEFGAHDKLTLNIAFLFGVGLATLFRFWSYRRFVWLAQPGDAEASVSHPLSDGYEARQPALVPSEPLPQPAPRVGGQQLNGQSQQLNGQAPLGQARPSGPRHARPR
jgi:putative flippase GtrA